MNSLILRLTHGRGNGARIRITKRDFDHLTDHLQADPSQEQFAFALFRPLKTRGGPILLVEALCLPGPEDLETQTECRISPTRAFQSVVYAAAEAGEYGILDIHTHVTDGYVAFSTIDIDVAKINCRYICERLSPPCTHAMLVFNSGMNRFGARYTDRSTGRSLPILSIEVVGRPFKILHDEGYDPAMAASATHQRQKLMPGWNQSLLAAQRVTIVGAGGNGAVLVQTLASIGVGANGWFAIVDPDTVELSNLPRIPYALPADVGRHKVSIAAEFIRRKDPRTSVHQLPHSVADYRVASWLRGSTVLFGAGDNDGVRKICNQLALRYRLLYVDLGCDIQTENASVLAGGQVRVIIPGQTGCLVCTRGFDPATAVLDLLDDDAVQRRAAAGYVIGRKAPTTPSIACLNALTAQMAVLAFLSLMGGGPFKPWDYAHIDFLSGLTMTAMTHPRESCPACGADGLSSPPDGKTASVNDAEPSWMPTNPDLKQKEMSE